jgi:hypothetical protein
MAAQEDGVPALTRPLPQRILADHEHFQIYRDSQIHNRFYLVPTSLFVADQFVSNPTIDSFECEIAEAYQKANSSLMKARASLSESQSSLSAIVAEIAKLAASPDNGDDDTQDQVRQRLKDLEARRNQLQTLTLALTESINNQHSQLKAQENEVLRSVATLVIRFTLPELPSKDSPEFRALGFLQTDDELLYPLLAGLQLTTTTPSSGGVTDVPNMDDATLGSWNVRSFRLHENILKTADTIRETGAQFFPRQLSYQRKLRLIDYCRYLKDKPDLKKQLLVPTHLEYSILGWFDGALNALNGSSLLRYRGELGADKLKAILHFLIDVTSTGRSVEDLGDPELYRGRGEFALGPSTMMKIIFQKLNVQENE